MCHKAYDTVTNYYNLVVYTIFVTYIYLRVYNKRSFLIYNEMARLQKIVRLSSPTFKQEFTFFLLPETSLIKNIKIVYFYFNSYITSSLISVQHLNYKTIFLLE